MSNYNSQLQSNNIDLQTVLQTLQTKAAGGVETCNVTEVTIDNGRGAGDVFYFDADKCIQYVPVGTSVTVKAFNGVVCGSSFGVSATGNYLFASIFTTGYYLLLFLEDGGAAIFAESGGSAN